MAGADGLIFARDLALIAPLTVLFFQQFLRREVHPAYIIFALVIALHGLVMVLNLGSAMAVVYSAKMLMTLLAGAILADRLFKPSRAMLTLILALWAISWVGIFLDKYFITFPWTGMETTIGDIKVELSRDWQIGGASKRAAGFMRSSIFAATVMPLMAFMLMFHLRRRLVRWPIALLTAPALFWTTQKGPLIAYVLALGIVMLFPKKPIPLLRLGVLGMLLLCICLPVFLSGAVMPSGDGDVFSLSSFYQRIEQMWPQAWLWIHAHEAFPFGVGLGGISGAQRLYALNDMNAADNMFILMYAFFGVMSFVYLGFIGLVAIRIPGNASRSAAQAMATLMFLIGYGCVISLLEDQMATLFLGGAVAWLSTEIKSLRDNKGHKTTPPTLSPRSELVVV